MQVIIVLLEYQKYALSWTRGELPNGVIGCKELRVGLKELIKRKREEMLGKGNTLPPLSLPPSFLYPFPLSPSIFPLPPSFSSLHLPTSLSLSFSTYPTGPVYVISMTHSKNWKRYVMSTLIVTKQRPS